MAEEEEDEEKEEEGNSNGSDDDEELPQWRNVEDESNHVDNGGDEATALRNQSLQSDQGAAGGHGEDGSVIEAEVAGAQRQAELEAQVAAQAELEAQKEAEWAAAARENAKRETELLEQEERRKAERFSSSTATFPPRELEHAPFARPIPPPPPSGGRDDGAFDRWLAPPLVGPGPWARRGLWPYDDGAFDEAMDASLDAMAVSDDDESTVAGGRIAGYDFFGVAMLPPDAFVTAIRRLQERLIDEALANDEAPSHRRTSVGTNDHPRWQRDQ